VSAGGPLVAAGVLLAAAQFATGVSLVEVYVSVSDASGGAITDLKQEDFEVLEDGTPQPVTAFVAGDFPLAVALAVDRSWSMAGTRLALARAGSIAFLRALRPEDRALVLAIGSEIEVLAPLGAGRAGQIEALTRLDAWGTTPLHDAIIAGIDEIRPASGRRALVLVSDGDERYSEASAAEALEHARRADVLVYPIATGRARPALFAELAVATGGRSYHLRDGVRLAETLGEVAAELRHQYLLGYVPRRAPADDGAWRSIQVRVDRPGVRVRARDGYFAR
jgi:Ca-activated chloride channel homolog